MSATAVHVAVRPGQGVVARTGPGLLVVLDGGSDAVREQLLQAFAEACEGQDTPGRGLARKLVGLLSQTEPDDVPSFGACAPSERGWAVILHQGIALHVEYDGGTTSLSGYDASTWVDRIVEDGFTSLTLLADGEPASEVDTRFRFDGGVIPGGGATILPAEAVPAAAAVPSPAPGGLTADGTTPAAPAEEEDVIAASQAEAPAPAPLPERPVTAQGAPPAEAPAEAPAPVAAQPTAPPPAPMPSAAPVAPTPTPDPTQQPAAASAADGFFAQAPGAPPAAEEAEPPTLIQASDRPDEPMPAQEGPSAEALPADDVPFESFPLTDIGAEARRDPLPILSGDTPKEEIEDSEAPLVYGVLSPAGYFNHPDALFCAVTGVSMLHRTHVLVQRPRPPLGVVVADDGSTFTLNTGYVVGREPERDPLVESGEARPLKLTDNERSLSRVHAELRLMDWDVVVVDRGSANGTYVLPRGGQQWKRLVADTPEKITPGTRVAFGKRVMTYESHHQINQAAAS